MVRVLATSEMILMGHMPRHGNVDEVYLVMDKVTSSDYLIISYSMARRACFIARAYATQIAFANAVIQYPLVGEICENKTENMSISGNVCNRRLQDQYDKSIR